MRRVLFSVSVMAAFGGMCTGGLGLDELGADLDAGGTEAAIEAEPAEPALAVPVGGEAVDDDAAEDCCCEVPDGEARLEAAAACAERGGACAEAKACETTEATTAEAEGEGAKPAATAPSKPRSNAGKTLTREEPRTVTREEPRTVTRPGEKKVVKPSDGATKQVERK